MDFSFNNKLVATSGPLRPSGRNLPIDGRTRVDKYSDIKDIPNPYAGMKITVLADETNNGEMTEYIVKTLKANALGQPNALIDEVIRYIDFLGVATSGGISEEKLQEINSRLEEKANKENVVSLEKNANINIAPKSPNTMTIKDTDVYLSKGNGVLEDWLQLEIGGVNSYKNLQARNMASFMQKLPSRG